MPHVVGESLRKATREPMATDPSKRTIGLALPLDAVPPLLGLVWTLGLRQGIGLVGLAVSCRYVARC